jgi:septal ring factor EnvC (AmiA/AmiB activator)
MSRSPAFEVLLARAGAARAKVVEAEAAAVKAELAAILAALEAAHGSQRAAAAAVGFSVPTVQRRLAAAGFTAEQLRERWPLSGRQPAPGAET